MEKMRETTIVGMRLRKDMAKSANTLLLLFSEMLWISSRDPGPQGAMIWSKISSLQI